MIFEEYKPLAPFTTFGIGGPARWFVSASSEDEIVEAVQWAEERGVRLFVLGGGSNLLVSDAGFDGLVLQVGLLGIAASAAPDEAGHIVYQAAAGEDWDQFVERTVQDGCAGVECLAGIPGTVGGTPVQNVGAYGQEAASAIALVRAYGLHHHRFIEFSAAECGFAYRRSRFNSTDRERYIVSRVDYRLTPGGAPTVRYGDLHRALAESRPGGGELSLAEVAAVVRRVRKTKGMLMVDGDPDCRSAGSFFKNPVVTAAQMRSIAEDCGKEPPCYPFEAGVGLTSHPSQNTRRMGHPALPDSSADSPSDSAISGLYKIPAAWLIEQAGFQKGYVLGNAGVSSRHTLALTNRGGASAAEILALADQIVATIEDRFSIRLEMEPMMVGF
jgi:UDP-N-acetylmuramate dehydrogenase